LVCEMRATVRAESISAPSTPNSTEVPSTRFRRLASSSRPCESRNRAFPCRPTSYQHCLRRNRSGARVANRLLPSPTLCALGRHSRSHPRCRGHGRSVDIQAQ
jgi:hypothetical protein